MVNSMTSLSNPDGLDNKYLSTNALHTIAKQYSHRGAFQLAESAAYQQARKQGLLDDICSHMVRKTKWTHAAIKKEAHNHMTRGLFRGHSNDAYQAAARFGILDEVCSHMQRRTKWTQLKIWTGVKQLNDYTEFTYERNLYAAAHVRDMLGDIKRYYEEGYTERLDNMPWPANKDG